MKETYSHPVTGEAVSFREPLTQESIAVAVYGFGSNGEVDAKRDIFDPRWLQVGRHFNGQEGVFTNTGTITNEAVLQKMLAKAEKVNGIYLINDQMAFAPYESFKQGEQDGGDFVEGGLARELEHTQGKTASNLALIADRKNYPRGVYVGGFNTSFSGPRVSALGSSKDDRLYVYGYIWDDYSYGYAFGVLDSSRSDAPKKGDLE
jgi:hypothetical protein